MDCSINTPAVSLFVTPASGMVRYRDLVMKHLVIGQCQKVSNFSAFHWSPHGSLVSIGQHIVIANINTEIEVDLNTESDHAVQAVHSCTSWF